MENFKYSITHNTEFNENFGQIDRCKNVTIIIPCRNEEKFILPLLDSIIAMDYPSDRLEVIVADGMSDDGTRDIVSTYARKHLNIKMIDNPAKVVPHALNAAIRLAQGDFIIRMDAHSIYPANYVRTLIEILQKSGADNVGACWETIPGNDTLKAKAIAYATSHPFGVGNATYRLYNPVSEPFEVDTVPFGCYRKEIFEKIGFFDEELIRNQDNELNERILQAGGKILLVPSLKIQYFARESYRKLWKMFYQYGYFGPLVDIKLGRPTRLRKYVPSAFVLAIALPLLLSLFQRRLKSLSYFVVSLYSLVAVFVSTALAARKNDLKLLPFLVLAFLISHLSYGCGYLKGYLDFKILGKRSSNDLKLSR